MTEPAIVLAVPERLPDLAGVLARAFLDDPMIQWPLGYAGTVEIVATMFEALYAEPIRRGMLWDAGEADGVAVWIPPGGATDLFDADRQAREGFAEFLFDGGDALRRDVGVARSADPRRAALVPRCPRLRAIASGTGVGGALIRHGLGLAAADGVGAFLETARAGNVGYYERFGFRLTRDADVPGGGPHIWFMRRDA